MNQFVNPVNRPFWPGPLPNSQQRGRGQSFLFARGRRSKQLLSMLVSSAESENTQPTKSSSHTSSELNFNESGGNYNSANWGNVEERCNKISPFQHKKSVFKFNIYTPKKGLRYHRDKRKKIEQAHSLYTFQNEGSFSHEGKTSQRGPHVQYQP